MTTLRLKTNSPRADALIAEHQAIIRYKPKKKAYGHTHMDQFVGQPVELRLSTGEILTGCFTLTRYDILLNCDDGRVLCCHKHQIVWCRLTEDDET